MKICNRCGELNSKDSLICGNCNSSSKFFRDYEEEAINSEKNINKKNRVNKNIIKILFIIGILLIGLLVLLNLSNETLSINLIFKTIVFIAIGAVLTKFTEEVFILTHIFSIKDLKENQMSDMYDAYLKFLGMISIVFSVIVLIKPLLL